MRCAQLQQRPKQECTRHEQCGFSLETINESTRATAIASLEPAPRTDASNLQKNTLVLDSSQVGWSHWWNEADTEPAAMFVCALLTPVHDDTTETRGHVTRIEQSFAKLYVNPQGSVRPDVHLLPNHVF